MFAIHLIMVYVRLYTGKVSGSLVTKSFQAWQKKSENANHEKTTYHQCSFQMAKQLLHSVEHPERNIPALFHSRRADNIARNRGILKSVDSAILFCAKQCIALRGDAEQLDTPGNPYSMGMSRLSSLALLHIHYDMDVDLDEVVTRYAHLHPRKLELDSIIRP